MSEPSPYCGRIDEHGPHEWIGWHGRPPWLREIHECPGAPVIEGGHGPYLGEPVELLGPRALALAHKHVKEILG